MLTYDEFIEKWIVQVFGTTTKTLNRSTLLTKLGLSMSKP